MHLGPARPSQLLGPSVWYMHLPPLLSFSRGDHQCVLQPDGETSPKRPHPFGVQGERPQPSAHHAHGTGGGRRLHRVLDTHPYHGPGAVAGLQPRQRSDGGVHAFLHRPGLRQQQPESRPLRIPRRKLQTLLS